MKKIMIVPVALLLAGISLHAQDNTAGIEKAGMDKKKKPGQKRRKLKRNCAACRRMT